MAWMGTPLFAKAMQHGEDGFALLLLFGGVSFDVEVVVGEEGGGIGFVSGAEGEVDVVFADILSQTELVRPWGLWCSGRMASLTTSQEWMRPL